MDSLIGLILAVIIISLFIVIAIQKYESKTWPAPFAISFMILGILIAFFVSKFDRINNIQTPGMQIQAEVDIRDIPTASIKDSIPTFSKISQVYLASSLVTGSYQGNKKNYESLLNMVKDSENQFLKRNLEQRVEQIQVSYVKAENNVRNFPLCKAHVECTQLEDENSTTLDNIYDQFLNESLWMSRAKAAYLLRFSTNKKIEETNKTAGSKISRESIISSLVNAISKPEERILVSKTALDSFRYLVPEFQAISPVPTIERPETAFDFDKAEKYWQQYRSTILGQL